jgi:hypothetical protein
MKMKRIYMIPETKISEFKGKQMAICLSIAEGKDPDDSEVLSRSRQDSEWGNLWE